MPFDITNLTPGQIAALAAGASVFGAVVAFVGGLTVSIVNAVAARRLDAARARREYLQRTLFPVLDHIETTVRMVELHIANVERFSREHSDGLADHDFKEYRRVSEIQHKQFQDLPAMGSIHAEPSLKTPWVAFNKAVSAAGELATAAIDAVKSPERKQTDVDVALKKVMEGMVPVRETALAFRHALEKVLF